MTKEKDLKLVADELWSCVCNHTTMSPISQRYSGLTIDDAYLIQLATVDLRLASGQKIVGKKIGLTSKAMQEMFSIDTPDYGHLYDSMVWPEDQPVPLSILHKPRVEPEIAFILGDDLQGPGITFIDVLRSTAGIVPCFEIIDSRITNWEITIVDSISDNASAAMVMLGSEMKSIRDVNLKNIGLVLEKNGELIDFSAGAAVMGHPALSVAWLANRLHKYGVSLKKGEIILSGSLTKALDVAKGDVFTAFFDGLMPVKAVFSV
jgi:2-keto-4-pentenoate hydratase